MDIRGSPVTVWRSLATPVLTEGLMRESRGEKVYLLYSARAWPRQTGSLFLGTTSQTKMEPRFTDRFLAWASLTRRSFLQNLCAEQTAHQKIKTDHPPEKNVVIF